MKQVEQEFEIIIQHDVVEECTVIVKASSFEEAIEKARVMDLSEQDWKLTDFIGDNSYYEVDAGSGEMICV